MARFGSFTAMVLFLYLVFVALTPVRFDYYFFGVVGCAFLALETLGRIVDGGHKHDRVTVWDV